MKALHMLLAVLLATAAVGALGLDDLPSFPAPPASLLELTSASASASSSSSLGPLPAALPLHEPAAASLIELDQAEALPPSEIAVAAAIPQAARDPLTAALAIEVPDPSTFLKDDVFLQQLERQHAAAEAREAAEAGVDAQAEHEGFFDDLIANQPLQEPPRRRTRAPAEGRPTAQEVGSIAAGDTAALTDLYNNRPGADRAGPHLASRGGLLPSHRRGAAAKRFPEHDQASHQEVVPRTFRSAAGHFERNLAFRDTHSPKDSPFPHHGGHSAAPHNKGRPEAKANQPRPPPSRHLRAVKARGFPKAVSQRKARAAARKAAAQRRADRLAGKRTRGGRRGGRKGRRSQQRKGGKGLNRAGKGKKGRNGGKARAGQKGGKGRKGGKGGKGGRSGKGGKGGKGQSRKGGKGRSGKGGKGGKGQSGKGQSGKGQSGKGGKGGKNWAGKSGIRAGGSRGGSSSKNQAKSGKGGKGGKGQGGKGQGKVPGGFKGKSWAPKNGKLPSAKGTPSQPSSKPTKDRGLLASLGKVLHDKTRELHAKARAKSDQLLGRAEDKVNGGISRVAEKLKGKVGKWGALGGLLTKGIDQLQTAAQAKVAETRTQAQAGVNGLLASANREVHSGINTSVQRAQNALRKRFGGFFTLAELKAELSAQRRHKGGKASRQAAPPTAFPTGFEHVNEQRADMRAEVAKFKDEEFAATQAAADLEKLKATVEAREAILKRHVDAKFKAHSNLHTMFGASNGVFDRLPSHPSQGFRGSPAHRSYTPARRIVPARLQRLEDQRRLARHRSYSRGMMADRYHQQLHGENLGVFAGPGEYTAEDSFLQMGEDGAVHDAPKMRELPPM